MIEEFNCISNGDYFLVFKENEPFAAEELLIEYNRYKSALEKIANYSSSDTTYIVKAYMDVLQIASDALGVN